MKKLFVRVVFVSAIVAATLFVHKVGLLSVVSYCWEVVAWVASGPSPPPSAPQTREEIKEIAVELLERNRLLVEAERAAEARGKRREIDRIIAEKLFDDDLAPAVGRRSR